MSAARDPRPLTGEPLALDLLNTRWMSEGTLQDLLTDVDGLAAWLASAGLGRDHAADDRMLRHVRQARQALQAAVDGSLEEGAPLVDAVLQHGRVRIALTPQGAVEHPRVERPRLGPGLARRARLPGAAQDRPGPDPVMRPRVVRAALPRHVEERHPALVLDGDLRQPREGVPPLRALQGRVKAFPKGSWGELTASSHTFTDVPKGIAGFPHTPISIRSTLPKHPSHA